MVTKLIPAACGAAIEGDGGAWAPLSGFECYVSAKDGRKALFSEAKCETRDFRTGVGEGFRCVYSDFHGIPGLCIETRIWLEKATGCVRYDLIPLSDAEIKEIVWPAPFEMDSREGQTVLPFMQGSLLQNYGGGAERFNGAVLPNSRGMAMRFFAQYDSRGGYVMLVDTAYDCGLLVDALPGMPVRVCCRWEAQLGRIGRERRLRLAMLKPGQDYNQAAMIYRTYIKSRGELVTLGEKTARNPKVAKYVNIPVCHVTSNFFIQPESHFYRPDEPEFNVRTVRFDEIGEKLKRLHRLGVKRLCLHLDGWGKMGYDNMHPDILPPCEASGGWEGLKRLRKTCHELGYFFGIHDQYRDYYNNCESFDLENAALGIDGKYPEIGFWYGGRQTVMCAKQAADYVRRNYNELALHGCEPDNAYLDVFSVVELDECDDPAHRMTRGECARARAACFREVVSRGIVVQSEELVDWALPYIDFVHWMPFALDKDYQDGNVIGKGIPLEFLVYHDCIISPYYPFKGGFGVPEDVDGYLLSLLYGCATYVLEDSDENDIKRLNEILSWQKQVQLRPMVRHEFTGAARQRCEFEGGRACEVDFETGRYQLF
ncbi:MAG: hypothetical protein IKV51_00795 [Clostridia bacterium]|nr:hypothetical protein [Clostridia bacterium]